MSEFDDPRQEPPHQATAVAGLRSSRSLGVAVLALSAVLVVGDVLSAASAPFALRAYHDAVRRGVDPATVVTAHDFAQLFVLAGIPLWVVASLWLTRAWRNAAALAPEGLQRSVVWCWLGWLVPVVAFWFPKQIIDDCWSITADRRAAADAPGRLRSTRTWWTLWIGYGVATYLLAGVAYRGPAVDRGVNVATECITAVLGVAALVAWAPVVRGLSATCQGQR